MPRHNVLRLLFKTVFSQLDYGRIHTMTPCLRLHWNIPLAITGRLTMTFVMVKLEETSLPQRRLSHYTFQYKRIARQELGTWIGTLPVGGQLPHSCSGQRYGACNGCSFDSSGRVWAGEQEE
jgi:hypothetical protein